MGAAFLSLTEGPGIKGIPEASSQAQSQILNRSQRATRIWSRGTGKDFSVKSLKTYCKKVRQPHQVTFLSRQWGTFMARHWHLCFYRLTHLLAHINTLGFHRASFLITRPELRCSSGAESRHSGYKLRNQSIP